MVSRFDEYRVGDGQGRRPPEKEGGSQAEDPEETGGDEELHHAERDPPLFPQRRGDEDDLFEPHAYNDRQRDRRGERAEELGSPSDMSKKKGAAKVIAKTTHARGSQG